MARKTLSCLIPLSTTVPKTKPPQYLTHYLNTGRSIDEAKAMIKTRTRIKTEIRKKKKKKKIKESSHEYHLYLQDVWFMHILYACYQNMTQQC